MSEWDKLFLTQTPYSVAKWLSIAALLAVLPLCLLLPGKWGLENGPLEWLEIALLVCNLSLAILLGLAWRTVDPARARFWLWSVPLWLLIIGRELSWGKVFLPGAAAGTPVSAPWYRPVVYPLQAVVVLSWFVTAARYRFPREVSRMASGRNFPWTAAMVALIALILASLAERHIVILPGRRNLLAEELFELVVYLCFGVAMLGLGRENGRTDAAEATPD